MYNDLVGPSNIDSDTEDKNTTDGEKQVENKDNVDDENNELPMPSNYIFPSFFAFMTWGPFACPDKRLSVFIQDDREISTGASRKNARNYQAKEKKMHHDMDASNSCGLTTDQKIDLATLNVQHQAMLDCQKESTLVALSMEDNALNARIEAAEKRAQIRCPNYDEKDANWIKVDNLIAMQDNLMNRIMDINKNEKSVPDIDERLDIEAISPSKKRAVINDEVDNTSRKKVSSLE